MKFFVDTADVAEIQGLAASGLLDIVPGPVSAAVMAVEHKKMLDEGRKLAKPAKNDDDRKAFLDDWAKTGQSVL
jgi:transaldolase